MFRTRAIAWADEQDRNIVPPATAKVEQTTEA